MHHPVPSSQHSADALAAAAVAVIMDDKASGNPEPASRDRSQEDTQPGDNKPSYKSWKKKYRKMRLQFDNCMQQSENLHQLEQKALRTAKRLAVENE